MSHPALRTHNVYATGCLSGRKLNQASVQLCTDVLYSESQGSTLAKFGSQPRCWWSSETVLRVRPGRGECGMVGTLVHALRCHAHDEMTRVRAAIFSDVAR